MVARVWIADVVLWEHTVAAVAWDETIRAARFEYAPSFLHSNIQIAPIMMPLGSNVYSFPSLARETYRGLPGLLSDCLPDRFGNALIDQWLSQQGRSGESFSPLERLCYLGKRGMGALEFRPALRHGGSGSSIPLEIADLVAVAETILKQRADMRVHTKGNSSEQREAMEQLLRVGTSAGGARAKAVIAWNPVTGEVRSGQGQVPIGFEHWLLKFDGVSNRDHESLDAQGFGRIEYAYHLMARSAGIQMEDCRLLEENGRAHFMTRRFDRTRTGGKLHMQSLCAMAHLDFNLAGAHSYEQCFQTMQRLGLPMPQLSEYFRRMVFNVLARNQDDHTRNTAFLMDKKGIWTLSPAFDVTYAFNPDGIWTSRHQMCINGKRDEFVLQDFLAIAKLFRIPKATQIIDNVQTIVSEWPQFAKTAGVSKWQLTKISKAHRHIKTKI